MTKRLLSVAVLGTLLSTVGLLTTLAAKLRAQTAASQEAQASAPIASMSANMCARLEAPARSGHSYHEEPPTGPLPPTLDPAQFADNKAAFVAYSIAAKIRELLYQEPCYCPCDKTEGHQSLLDCYTGWHGAGCKTCQMEAVFAYEQFKVGRSAAEIREAMEKGDLWKLELDKYVEAHYAEYKRSAP